MTKKQWLQEHDISTRLDVGRRWMAFTGKEAQFSAEESKKMLNSQLCFATTEEDAIERLAQRNGWPLWNEIVS
jgi:hypothetical protein